MKYSVHKVEIKNIDSIYKDVFEKWCQQNCIGIWEVTRTRYAAGFNADMYITFVKEEDAVAFKLRWI